MGRAMLIGVILLVAVAGGLFWWNRARASSARPPRP
jgi:hypothetical protein